MDKCKFINLFSFLLWGKTFFLHPELRIFQKMLVRIKNVANNFTVGQKPASIATHFFRDPPGGPTKKHKIKIWMRECPEGLWYNRKQANVCVAKIYFTRFHWGSDPCTPTSGGAFSKLQGSTKKTICSSKCQQIDHAGCSYSSQSIGSATQNIRKKEFSKKADSSY